MSDDQSFFDHLRSLDTSSPPQGSTAGRLLGATGATLEGAAKGIANVSGNLPTLVGLPALKSKWASSTNKEDRKSVV